MENKLNWKKPFFTIYSGQAFSLLSSSAVQFSIIWWINMETGFLCMLFLQNLGSIYFVYIVLFIRALGETFHKPAMQALIPEIVPKENLEKVISLVISIMSFAAPVGMFIAGPVSEWIGASHWMILAGVIMLGVGLLNYLLTRQFEVAD